MCELAAETAGGWVGVSSWEAAQVRHCLSLSFHRISPPFTPWSYCRTKKKNLSALITSYTITGSAAITDVGCF